MNKYILSGFTMAMGAAIGALVTWKVLDKKYFERSEQEIASVREAYYEKALDKCKTRDNNDDADPSEKARDNATLKSKSPEELLNDISENKEDKSKLVEENIFGKYQGTDEKEDYTSYSKDASDEQEKPVKEEIIEDPYIITPQEYGEFNDYEQVELTWYADHVLCEDGRFIVEATDLIGNIYPEDHFDEYDQNVVYVRDDYRKTDYEIIRDERTYLEAI